MSVRCPHCEHKFALKAAAGVYQPKCPDCGQQFAIAIPREPGGRVVSAKSLDHLKRYLAKQKQQAAGRSQAGTTPPADAPTVASAPAEMPTVASAPADQPTRAAPLAPSREHDPLATVATPAGHGAADPGPGHGVQGQPMGRLDGYELLRELGRGGMGCVYLARQVSLDRHVAVKTIAPQLAQSPAFLSRFVREAFAVAQLSHHNVVQIHDVGQDEAQHYFSMEYVPGKTLSDLVKEQGPLDPAQAATHTLHAARGLAYAHEHHMVHRDVKPANLLVNDQGLVKVTDLGLVKTAEGDGGTRAELKQAGQGQAGGGDPTATRPAAAMGTPAFMPPEQAKDSAAVDARADIYALGATLYYLLTGKPPLPARSAEEVLKLHATTTILPPEQAAPKVPKALSVVVMKMLAKRPADRHGSMAEVVSALEGLLGIGSGPFTPRPEHAQAIEDAADAFADNGAAKARRLLFGGFHLVALLATIVGIVLGNYALTGTAVWMWACTTVGYLGLSGLRQGGTLSQRVRQYLLTLGWPQWVMFVVGVLAFGAMLFVLGLVWWYLAFLVVGIGLAAAAVFGLDTWCTKQREPVLTSVRQMLRELRLRGLEERALRKFVCAYAGRRWEGLYEALFGYEAKREARKQWGYGEDGKARPRYGAWRDGIIDWLERAQSAREDERRRHQLQRAEMQRLRAEGVGDMEAMAKSRQAARDWFDGAQRYRATGDRQVLGEIYLNREITEAEAAGSQAAKGSRKDEFIPDSWKLRRTPLSTQLTYWLFAGRARAAVGGAMLLVWAWWVSTQHKLSAIPEGMGVLTFLRTMLKDQVDDPKALRIAPIPPAVFDVLCSHTALLAGVILVWAGLYRGVRLTFFLLPIIVMLLRAPFLGNGMWGPMTQQEWVVVGALAITPPAFFFGKSDY
jgi:hypothetical protein